MRALVSAIVAAVVLTALIAFNSQAKMVKVECGGDKKTAKEHRSWSMKLKGRHSIPGWAKQKHRYWLICAEGPGHRKAMKNQWRLVGRSILPRRHDLWVKIGRCEQPGSGYKGVNWSHKGPTYQGGLGFWYGTWSSFKYPGMPSNAGYATWREQMRVANRLYRMYGTSPWGCA